MGRRRSARRKMGPPRITNANLDRIQERMLNFIRENGSMFQETDVQDCLIQLGLQHLGAKRVLKKLMDLCIVEFVEPDPEEDTFIFTHPVRVAELRRLAFKNAVSDVIKSGRAKRNLDTLYPDATAEELSGMCIICGEGMSGSGSSKKLPCDHVFHASCLKSWFQWRHKCPTCQEDVSGAPAAAAEGSDLVEGMQQKFRKSWL